jgi:hypothetical protein
MSVESALKTPTVPVFELEVVAQDVTFEVRVNDVPVLRMPAGSLQTAFDVNPYVLDGDNSLSLTVRPEAPARDFSELSRCSLTVRRKTSPEAETGVTLATLAFTGYGPHPLTGFGLDAPVQVERFGARGSVPFVTRTPFGPWAWASAAKLVPSERLRAEVLGEMRKAHALMAARDGAKLAAWCALQAQDFQRAYGLASLAEATRMLGVARFVGDPTISAEPFPDTILTLELLGGGRLVQLVDDDGKSPLMLRSIEAPAMVGRFNCVFCKTAAGWQIAR